MPNHPNTVFVHGAGQQEDAILLKRRLDGMVFGGPQGDRTRLGYYSDVLHGPSPKAPGLERAATDPIKVAADPRATRAKIVAAIVMRQRTGFEKAEDPRRAALVDALLTRADEVAAAEPDATYGGGGLEGRRYPDVGFRIVVGILARDVVKYFFDGYGGECRERVRAALRESRDPVMVIAHSLGTIITFDVLSEREFASRNIVHLVTLGSPLGIENVQDELRERAGQPHPIPAGVHRWSNLADALDPVASNQKLAGEFEPNADGFSVVDDLTIDNKGFLNHALTGYLVISAVREAIAVA
jgi:hypothetical protein